MSWNCRLIEFTEDTKSASLVPGDMFFAPKPADDRGLWPFIFAADRLLTPYYREHNSHRRPLLVWMPGQFIWCVDALFGGRNALHGGHAVTGEAPKLTLDTEIRFADVYRGTLIDGVISDDLDRRTFSANGERGGTSSS